MHSLLVEADEADQDWRQQTKGVSIIDYVRGAGSGDKKQSVRQFEGQQEDPELLPGDACGGPLGRKRSASLTGHRDNRQCTPDGQHSQQNLSLDVQEQGRGVKNNSLIHPMHADPTTVSASCWLKANELTMGAIVDSHQEIYQQRRREDEDVAGPALADFGKEQSHDGKQEKREPPAGCS